MSAGRTLSFSTDARVAVIASGDKVHFARIGGAGGGREVEVGRVHDLIAVGDQFWVAAGDGPMLHRLDAQGQALAVPVRLWGPGSLCATTSGRPSAVWSAPGIAAFVGAEAAATEIPGAPEWVVPVSHNRWVTCTRNSIRLRDLTSERWTVPSPGGRCLDGATLFGGRTVALVFTVPADPSARQLVLLGLHDGALQQRLSLGGVEQLRFAPSRGFAAMRTGARQIVLLDLRFGRLIKQHTAERDVQDLAIDDAGQFLMLRYADGQDDVEILPVRDLRAPSAVVADAPPASPDAEAERAAGAEAAAPIVAPLGEGPARAADAPVPGDDAAEAAAPPVVDFHVGPSLEIVAVVPVRPRFEIAAGERAAVLLDHYRNMVRAMLGRTIAAAWNEGRLTFPNDAVLPFHAEVRGLLGTHADRAADEVVAAERALTQARAALRAAIAGLGAARTPLDVLAQEFGLSPLAQLILLVVAGPGLWGDLARLYGIVANDEARPLVDEQLLAQVLLPDALPHDVARELDRDAPLLRHGLIVVGIGKMRPFLPLRCETVVQRILRGDTGSTDVAGLRVVEQVRAFESLLLPAALKQAVLAKVATPPAEGLARIVIRGRDGSGRHTLLATIADAAGRQLAVVDASVAMRDLKHRSEELRASLRRAHLLGHLPVVDGVEMLPADDASAKDTAREIFDEHPGPLALRLPWDAQPPLQPGFVEIDLPQLSIEQRATAWRVILAEHGLAVTEPEELAVRYSVGPGVITRACVHVASLLRDRAPTSPDAPALDPVVELETAIRQHLETKLRATATRVTRLASWAQVVLPADIQDSVFELIARIKHRRIVYDTWGFDRVLTTARGVTALFSGGPGTGKTLVACAIANELGMDLYRVDLSRIMSKWIGETEQNLAKLFDAAEDGHAIILFDEADSLFAKRTEVKSSVDRYANLEVNYLLQRLDTFEGIAILTTNFGTSIDPAFKRRLSFRLSFPFPDDDAREQLWRSHLPPNMPRAGAFDFADLGRRFRLSGGYIRNAAVRAAFLAAEEHVPLTQEHLERAIRAEFREMNKLADNGVLE